jgi:hypothetical protein
MAHSKASSAKHPKVFVLIFANSMATPSLNIWRAWIYGYRTVLRDPKVIQLGRYLEKLAV